MTEGEWTACTDFLQMLEFVRKSGTASDRKLRLFARHCFYRLHPHGISADGFLAVNFAELFADGGATAEELAAARTLALNGLAPYRFMASELYDALAAATDPDNGEVPATARHVFVALYQTGMYEFQLQAEGVGICQALRDLFVPLPFRSVTVDPAWLSWSGGTVRHLAQAAYEERHLPSGELDSARLAVLADALEEAGCTDADILSHLRGPGPHVRGCWALDLLLGKG